MSQAPWLARYGDIPADIDPDAWPSLVHLLEDALCRHAARPAFRAAGRTLTYADVDRLSRDFAAYLQHGLGVKKGERVAVMLPNLLAFPVALLGIARAGAVQVNVNPLYTARELAYQLDDAGAQVIVVFEGVRATVDAVRAHTLLKTVLVAGLADAVPAGAAPGPHACGVAVATAAEAAGPAPAAPATETVPATQAGTQAGTFAEALRLGASLPFTPVALAGDDALFLQYTGGTTGRSKGALLSRLHGAEPQWQARDDARNLAGKTGFV